MFFDPFMFHWSVILLIPALILSIYAQNKVSSTFNKYSKIPNKKGLTAYEVARILLDSKGLSDIPILPVAGELTDHYDPVEKRLGLSEVVYGSNSVAALGVAAHEVGHAIQHLEGYTPIVIRNSIFPLVSFGNYMSMPLFLIGIFIHSPLFVKLGIIFFSFYVFFSIITLPVEIDASMRGLRLLRENGLLDDEEYPLAKEVLTAAALTYIAAALMAVMNLIRLLIISQQVDDD